MSSPAKKKKLDTSSNSNSNLKRVSDSTEGSSKRPRTEREVPLEEDLQAKKRRNFIRACELVSYKAYYDHNLRFQLIHLPPCAEHITCKHYDHKNGINSNKVMSFDAEQKFKYEIKDNMWNEALEVCRLCITPDQYLSANVLKDIVEIMLNAHNNEYADYTIDYLLDKCQQILELNFSHHPPCLVKSLRECYNDFLTSPMDLKNNTFSNRSEFGCDNGILKYCLNRLDHEISLDSKDDPLFDKCEYIPEDMRQTVKRLHWEKMAFEIYEQLERNERIKRLIAVLDSIIELLQCDLAIWHRRCRNNLVTQVIRSHKPLIANLLWSNNEFINNNCRQILRIFVYMIYLQYPEEHIRTMTVWLNTIVQTIYICENNLNSDYPDTGKFCTAFANEFYKIVAEMPHETVIKILERIRPNYMQYLIGTLHIKKLLETQDHDPIRIFTEFVRNAEWKKFRESAIEIDVCKKKKYIVKNLLKHLKKRCNHLNTIRLDIEMQDDTLNNKFDPDSIPKDREVSLNHVIHTFYLTLKGYLDAYSVQNIQETLAELNEQLENGSPLNDQKLLPEICKLYTVSENFIKKYRAIYQSLQELVLILQNLKNSGDLPKIFQVFERIGLLGM